MAAQRSPPEGTGLQGGEEGVEFGQVGALAGFLLLNGFDDCSVAVLKLQGRPWTWKTLEFHAGKMGDSSRGGEVPEATVLGHEPHELEDILRDLIVVVWEDGRWRIAQPYKPFKEALRLKVV